MIEELPTTNYLKRLLTIFVFLLTTTVIPQWNRQSPQPTHLEVRGVVAPVSQRVFIATDDNSFDDGGALFESTDGGMSWTQLNIPTSLGDPLNGLYFLDSQNGWAYGNANYRTLDGGTTWTQLPFLGSTYGMKFYTPTFGVATGNFGRYISRNGGNAWVESPNGMYAFNFTNNLLGLGVADSALYRTTDGGDTFLAVYTGNAKAAVFLSSTVAVAIVSDIYIRSTDGGATWTSGAAVNGRNRLLAVSSDILISWNQSSAFPPSDSSISRSTDGGQTWSDLNNIIPEGILALTPINSQTVVASDKKGNMYRSSDAGLTWTQTFVSPGPAPTYFSSATPVFADAQTGYFGYGSGFVIKTTNAGTSWFQISSGSGQSLNDVASFANGNMIAVGENGVVLTSNGTSSWVQEKILTSQDLIAVQVLSTSDVLIVDKEGQLYKSIDGGKTWTTSGSKPANFTAKDLRFSSLLEGWITGTGFDAGALFHTVNGGSSWTAIPDISGSYIALDFESVRGWALNSNGNYYRTNDNGATWNVEELPGFPSQVNDIEFFNTNSGYVVGAGGYAARSNDGGSTWQVLPTNSTDNFTDIYMLSANELWISTNNNKAYYSANGGQNWAVLDMGSEGFGNFSAIAANANGDAWVVGYQGYIEHFSGPPPPPLNQAPIASFEHISAGLTVRFTDTSTDLDGIIVSWSWDFGDSTSSTEQNPTHSFAEANTYIIRLTVTDDDGDNGSTIRIIAVQPNPGGTFGDFTEVTPLDSIFVTPEDEDFWVITTAPADFDGDGDTDIAVLGYYVIYNQSVEDRLVLLRNDGASDSAHWGFTYVNVPFEGFTAGSSDLTWGDLDRDGDLDLVVGTDGATAIYRNDVGILVLSNTELPGYLEDNDQADFDLQSITLTDFDNDGDLDILIPSVFDDSTFTFRTALMRNDGTNGTDGWIFSEAPAGFAPTIHAQSSWADYDGDLDLDLLLVNMAPINDEGFIRRYTNNGDGTFTGEDILGALTVEHGEAQWGDYDGDGDLDILIAGNVKEINGTYTPQALRVYRNDSTGYAQVEVIDCIPCVGWVDLTAATWADYDSDGDMDILLAGSYNPGSQIDGRAKIYINTNGTFSDSGNDLPAPRASGTRGGTFSWLDIDGEGDLDYFIAGQYFVPGGNGLVEAQMHLYRNDATGQNLAPTTPGGMNAAIQPDKSVVLSWTPATDDHTPSVALTYDLELFHNNVPVTIPKRLPEPGSISAVNEWFLSGLQDGNYKWTLRAVDAAYIGSSIVTGSFTVGLTGTDNQNNSLPTVYSIAQNYPNPFNPSTSIKYSIPKEGLVTLKIYNSLGEEQKILVDEIKQAGNYELTFDAGILASGVYFYRIISGSYTETKKMLLLK